MSERILHSALWHGIILTWCPMLVLICLAVLCWLFGWRAVLAMFGLAGVAAFCGLILILA